MLGLNCVQGEKVDFKAAHYAHSRQLYAYIGITVQLQVQSPYGKNLLDCTITNRDPFLTLRGRVAIEYVCSISCHVITRTAMARPYPAIRDRYSRLTNETMLILAKYEMRRLCRLASTMTTTARLAPPRLPLLLTTTTAGRSMPQLMLLFVLLLTLPALLRRRYCH